MSKSTFHQTSPSFVQYTHATDKLKPAPHGMNTRGNNLSSMSKNTGQRKQRSKSIHGLPVAPVFYPDKEEFQDSIGYINKIAPIGEKYGIIKIVPPAGWNPPMQLDMNKFSFRTRRQDLHMMDLRFREIVSYDERVYRFFCNLGMELPESFFISNTSIDLYSLMRCIDSHASLSEKELKVHVWKRILRELSIPFTNASLKEASDLYLRYIFPFEDFVRKYQTSEDQCFETDLFPKFFTKDEHSNISIKDQKTSKHFNPETNESVGILQNQESKRNEQIKQQYMPADNFGSNDNHSHNKKRRLNSLSTNNNHLCDNCHKPVNCEVEDTCKEAYCTKCIINPYEFGFETGNYYTLSNFEKYCDNFKKNYFSKFKDSEITEDIVEKEYWKLVKDNNTSLEVEYGADLSTLDQGSAFPSLAKNPVNPYSKDTWNLNVIASTNGSLLSYIDNPVSGITCPWLYVGMCFSTFCWHVEDNYTYSVNYQHYGDTKLWYGIPGDQAERFERAALDIAPDLVKKQKDLLYQLATMINPDELQKRGVDVYFIDQGPNEFVITFPKSFHAGINHGFNINEAVNFAPKDWLLNGFSLNGVLKYQSLLKPPVLSHDMLVYNLATNPASEISVSELRPWVHEAVKRELGIRSMIRGRCDLKEILYRELMEDAENWQCQHCKAFSYFSQVACSCKSITVCPIHIEYLCKCDLSNKTLRLKVDDNELQKLLSY